MVGLAGSGVVGCALTVSVPCPLGEFNKRSAVTVSGKSRLLCPLCWNCTGDLVRLHECAASRPKRVISARLRAKGFEITGLQEHLFPVDKPRSVAPAVTRSYLTRVPKGILETLEPTDELFHVLLCIRPIQELFAATVGDHRNIRRFGLPAQGRFGAFHLT